MPGQTRQPPLSEEQLEKTAAELDEWASKYFLQSRDKEATLIQRAILLAKSVQRLRNLLSDQIMEQLFMPLMNSQLGFLTDHGNPDAKDAEYRTPYSLPVVRDCLIDAFLCGFRPTGNEINIIAGRAMGVLNGWKRLFEEIPGLSKPRCIPGTVQYQPVPNSVSRAFVRVVLEWELNGAPGKLTDHEGKPGIAFEVDQRKGFAGPDALIGKAKRRAYKLAYETITGTRQTLADGDVGDAAGVQENPPELGLGRNNLRPSNGIRDMPMRQAAPPPEPDKPQEPSDPEPSQPVDPAAGLAEGELPPDLNTPEGLAHRLTQLARSADTQLDLMRVDQEREQEAGFLGAALNSEVKNAIYARDNMLRNANPRGKARSLPQT